MAGNDYTVKVSNVSSKATAREIEDFFSFSGQVEKVDLRSDGEDSQTAYVTFKDQDSLKTALLLSGSAILDKEVKISALTNSGVEKLASDPGDEIIEAQAGENSPIHPRLGPLNRAQDVMRAMLSRRFTVGKDALKRTNSMEQKNKSGINGENTGISSNDMDNELDAAAAAAAATTTMTSNTSSSLDATTTGSKSNAKINIQKCYKHVLAINERLQIGQRTMSALVVAQQGVMSAGSAVASNKYVAAGGVWVNGAISKVTTKSSNSEAGGNHSPSHSGNKSVYEQVQLTEMTSLQSHKAEED